MHRDAGGADIAFDVGDPWDQQNHSTVAGMSAKGAYTISDVCGTREGYFAQWISRSSERTVSTYVFNFLTVGRVASVCIWIDPET